MTQDSSDEDDEQYSPFGGPGGVSMAMGTVEDPLKEDLARPEFEGLWNKQHKAIQGRINILQHNMFAGPWIFIWEGVGGCKRFCAHAHHKREVPYGRSPAALRFLLQIWMLSEPYF